MAANNVQILDPVEIRYCQETRSNRFQDGKRIQTTFDEIRSGTTSIDDIPMISVAKREGEWYAQDNRRLKLFKKLKEKMTNEHENINQVCSDKM